MMEVGLSSFLAKNPYPEVLDAAEGMLASALRFRWPAVTEVKTERRFDGPFSWEDEYGVRHTRPAGWAIYATGLIP